MSRNILTRAAMFSILFLCAVSAGWASPFVHGSIYMKDGTVIECGKNDRIRLPRRSGKAVFLRNAYTREKERTTYSAVGIDSILAWHPATPEHIRKFVPSERPGWMWVYFETPEIRVCIYSAKGYGIGANGGIEVRLWSGLIFRSRTAYCLRRTGEEEYEAMGTTEGRSNGRFRRRLAEYVVSDPSLAGKILESRGRRDKTVLMLREYRPE